MNSHNDSTNDTESQKGKEPQTATTPIIDSRKEQTIEVVKIDATKIMKIDPANLPAKGNPPSKPQEAIDKPGRLEPTRYGDWEKNGRCIDF